MHVLTIPEVTWAKFTCIGPLSSTAGRKYKAFLSMAAGNQEYDIAANMYIVWYTPDEDEVS